jgi:hypothetical protein
VEDVIAQLIGCCMRDPVICGSRGGCVAIEGLRWLIEDMD